MDEKLDTTKEMKGNLGKTTALVVSFDCTGSMSPCIQQVRQNLKDLVEMMRQDIPDLKIGLIGHGDYCDGDDCIHILDLTDDLEKIMSFINDTPNLGGGDAPECYELVLNRARGMSWPDEGGSLVLIGDDEPHAPDYPGNTDHLDWRQEIAALKEKNVNVFPMQCLMSPSRVAQNKFWEDVSGVANTPLLLLESFGDSSRTLEACAYASAGVRAYDSYMGKVVSAGFNASPNLYDNASKLKCFVDTKATEIKTETTTK